MLKIQNIQNTLTPLHPKVIFHHPCHLRSPGHLQNLSSERVPSNPKVTRLRSERSTKRASSKIHETWINGTNVWINQKNTHTPKKEHTHSINVPHFLGFVFFRDQNHPSRFLPSFVIFELQLCQPKMHFFILQEPHELILSAPRLSRIRSDLLTCLVPLSIQDTHNV